MRRKTICTCRPTKDVVLRNPPTRDWEAVSLTVDGLDRHMGVRTADDADIDDVVVWAPGGGGYGPGFLGHVTPATRRADIGPTALHTDIQGPVWVIPGVPPTDDRYPPSAPSDDTDLHFMESIVAYAQARWGSDVRIWFVGMSKGALLGWACLAYNQDFNLPFRGFYFACAGMPADEITGLGIPAHTWGYGWSPLSRIGQFARRPVALSHGGDTTDAHSQEFGNAMSWSDTSNAMLAIAGGDGSWSDWIDLPGACSFSDRVRVGQGVVVGTREYEIIDGPHAWLDCPRHATHPFREAAVAIGWFGLLGLGS